MNLTQVIQSMREISNRGDYFSFQFKTYSEKEQTGGITRTVQAASIRSNPERKGTEKVDPDLFLEYLDADNSTFRHCYKHLIISFNGEPVTL